MWSGGTEYRTGEVGYSDEYGCGVRRGKQWCVKRGMVW